MWGGGSGIMLAGAVVEFFLNLASICAMSSSACVALLAYFVTASVSESHRQVLPWHAWLCHIHIVPFWCPLYL